MIIVKLSGGLGNQMFQYAAGLALATLRRTVLKLDVGWFGSIDGQENHEAYALSCFNITEQFATAHEAANLVSPPRPDILRKFYRTVRGRSSPQPRSHIAGRFSFYPEFHAIADNTHIEGNWQSEQFFAPAAALLRRQFTPRYPLPLSARELAAQIQADPTAVAVHFRRGDYVSGKAHVYCRALEIDYYNRALDRIKAKVSAPSLYIFSDDIEQVAKEFHPDCHHHFVRPAADWRAFDEIQLMSFCRHNVIANSTFSWWGAWLNENPEKIVIGPATWFADNTFDGSDILPKNWVALPVKHVSIPLETADAPRKSR